MAKFRILSIDGGGYLGLASAACINGIEDHFGTQLSERFDLFCGTSTGAILSLALASGRSGSDLVDLYKRLGNRVFPATTRICRTLRSLRQIVWSKYGHEPLRQILKDEFGESTLDDLKGDGKMALITAFCLTTGKPRIFKTDHSENLSLHGGYQLVDIALASSAAPTFFPIVEISNVKNGVKELFCDGGVAANHPALLGFAEAVGELGIAPNDIEILSIGTPREDWATDSKSIKIYSRGIIQWGKTLPSFFIDGNSFLSDQILRRVVDSYPEPGPRYERIELANPKRLELDLATGYAGEVLTQHGVTAASCSKLRSSIAPILED